MAASASTRSLTRSSVWACTLKTWSSMPNCEISLSEVAKLSPVLLAAFDWRFTILRSGRSSMPSTPTATMIATEPIGLTNTAKASIASRLNAALRPVTNALTSEDAREVKVVSSSWSWPERSSC